MSWVRYMILKPVRLSGWIIETGNFPDYIPAKDKSFPDYVPVRWKNVTDYLKIRVILYIGKPDST